MWMTVICTATSSLEPQEEQFFCNGIWALVGPSAFQLDKIMLKSYKIRCTYLIINCVSLQTFWLPLIKSNRILEYYTAFQEYSNSRNHLKASNCESSTINSTGSCTDGPLYILNIILDMNCILKSSDKSLTGNCNSINILKITISVIIHSSCYSNCVLHICMIVFHWKNTNLIILIFVKTLYTKYCSYCNKF